METFKYNFEVSSISYIHIGGRINLFICTDNLWIIRTILKHEFQVKFIGNTSNILFAFIKKKMILIKYINSSISLYENSIKIGASNSLKNIYNFCLNNSYQGFSRISSIPGTLGGSIINNSSCFNQCISDDLIEVECLDKNGVKSIKRDEIIFKHHHAIFPLNNFLIISARFILPKERRESIKEEYDRFHRLKRKMQPYDILSLGSTFKNEKFLNVPFLMEKSKIKAILGNNCSFSSKHVNFLQINNKCEYENVIELIEEASMILYNNISYKFELEIELIF